eukprot:9095561-Pyramimonas_sp.AAC.1
MALEFLLRRRRCSGRTLRKLLGHITHQAMLRRELLSCFRAAYVFIEKYPDSPSKLWPAALRELRWAQALLPLLERDLTKPWGPRAYTRDASPWGIGICAARPLTEVLDEASRHSDRWHFLGEGRANPRA